MLGYVLDGQIDAAVNAVAVAVVAQKDGLRFIGEPILSPSRFLPDGASVFETAHTRAEPRQPFLVQHIFSAGVCV